MNGHKVGIYASGTGALLWFIGHMRILLTCTAQFLEAVSPRLMSISCKLCRYIIDTPLAESSQYLSLTNLQTKPSAGVPSLYLSYKLKRFSVMEISRCLYNTP